MIALAKSNKLHRKHTLPHLSILSFLLPAVAQCHQSKRQRRHRDGSPAQLSYTRSGPSYPADSDRPIVSFCSCLAVELQGSCTEKIGRNRLKTVIGLSIEETLSCLGAASVNTHTIHTTGNATSDFG